MANRLCGCCEPPGPIRAVTLTEEEEAMGADGTLVASYQCAKTGARRLVMLLPKAGTRLVPKVIAK